MGPTKSFTFSPGDLRVAMCSLQHFPVIGFVLASKIDEDQKNEGYFLLWGFGIYSAILLLWFEIFAVPKVDFSKISPTGCSYSNSPAGVSTEGSDAVKLGV